MAKVRDLAEAQARWEKIAERTVSGSAKGFRQGMQQVLAVDHQELQRAVYNQSKVGRRSGNLLMSEVLEFKGDAEASIKNTAASEWKGVRTYYAWALAKGVKARDKGRKYYAWMTDPRDPRPSDFQGWLDAVKSGRARIAHRLRAVKGTNWRKAAIERAQQNGYVVKAMQREQKKNVESA